ncbi:nucleotidyl transferase AbiEii/AbiGii toxin family protein [Nocardia sp. NPDC020380]|uniref:nucleotidyl transferase AbiEii/AbiGii toxin family protein n=1 Tax=Nocardia sp. NPDC020380 TaxID=3364309 RepID=UPI0037AB8895
MSSGFDERADIASRFGVSAAQVQRDYLISLVLAHLAERHAESVLFIGGTALARTHLPDGRLSEDIDLIALGRRTEIADRLTRDLPRAALRRFGRLKWRPALTEVSGSDAAYLMSDDESIILKIQLLSRIGMPSWPTESKVLVQRYRDAPEAMLRVPTRSAFVAGKTLAWCDRGAARDLWDLWALANIDAIDGDAAELFRRYGPTNKVPQPWQFATAPTERQWHAQLAGQTRLTVSAQDALEIVSAAWEQAAD